MKETIVHGFGYTHGERMYNTPEEREELLAEIERLRRELAKFTTRPGRHANKMPATEALARKAYLAALASCDATIAQAINTKAPEDVRQGFWHSAHMAGISINVMSRVSQAHHSRVKRFITSDTDVTRAFRKARDAAAAVFKEAAAT